MRRSPAAARTRPAAPLISSSPTPVPPHTTASSRHDGNGSSACRPEMSHPYSAARRPRGAAGWRWRGRPYAVEPMLCVCARGGGGHHIPHLVDRASGRGGHGVEGESVVESARDDREQRARGRPRRRPSRILDEGEPLRRPRGAQQSGEAPCPWTRQEGML